ncbi:MAG: hypothetical protein HYT71_01165 [Candidatus Aenigmarchaeota archaeon]|nr:hypothetical protein [Candidatus Aenigmarchaeota archaeon]
MKITKEGLVTLYLPDSRKEVFYNPDMELSRDISVAFLQALGLKNPAVCDLLSAAGARAVRYAKETDAVKVFANDASEDAVGYIKKNVSANKVDRKVTASRSGANAFLSSHKKQFDLIDIDPFGSPVYFLDELAKCARPDSYLGVTATDCGALSGIFPKTCSERYGIALERTECFKEIGVRNLIGVVASKLEKEKLFIIPLLSHATEHYIRIFLKIVSDGKNLSDYFYHCKKCNYCTFEKKGRCVHDIAKLGPIWAGGLHDKVLCFKILDKLKQPYFKKSGDARRMLLNITSESEEPFYYNIHKISERLSKNTPPVGDIVRQLRKSGLSATRTQFNDTSIKTDAMPEDIEKVIRILDKPRSQKPAE